MLEHGDIIKESVESLVTDVVIKARLDPVSRRIAKSYKIYSVASTAVKIGGHISYGNYYSAAGEAVKFIAINKASDIASSMIVGRGGFVSTITVADSGLVIEADVVDEVLHPLDSEWLTTITQRLSDARQMSAHQDLILQRSARAESQAAYARKQALRAAKIADAQDSTVTAIPRRALAAFFPWIEASFIRDGEHRFGQRRYPRGALYRGTFCGLKREGYGILQSGSSGEYVGMWRDDVPFGYGVRVFPNEIEYRGEYVRPLDQKAYGRNTGVSIDRRSGARFIGEHERQRWDGFNMIPDGYGQGRVKDRTLKGKWEAGIFLQHMECYEDIVQMAHKSEGRQDIWMKETVQTPLSEMRHYLVRGSSITLDGDFY